MTTTTLPAATIEQVDRLTDLLITELGFVDDGCFTDGCQFAYLDRPGRPRLHVTVLNTMQDEFTGEVVRTPLTVRVQHQGEPPALTVLLDAPDMLARVAAQLTDMISEEAAA